MNAVTVRDDAEASAVAIGTWLTTVLLAELMRRAGWRGPAEALLRRLTYAGPDRIRRG
jgi:uncharacterized protein